MDGRIFKIWLGQVWYRTLLIYKSFPYCVDIIHCFPRNSLCWIFETSHTSYSHYYPQGINSGII